MVDKPKTDLIEDIKGLAGVFQDGAGTLGSVTAAKGGVEKLVGAQITGGISFFSLSGLANTINALVQNWDTVWASVAEAGGLFSKAGFNAFSTGFAASLPTVGKGTNDAGAPKTGNGNNPTVIQPSVPIQQFGAAVSGSSNIPASLPANAIPGTVIERSPDTSSAAFTSSAASIPATASPPRPEADAVRGVLFGQATP